MSDLLFPVPESWAKSAWIDNDVYRRMYEQSISDPEGFWGEQAGRLDWFQPWMKVKEGSFDGDVRIRWFSGGKLNVSYNCLDRHLVGRGDQIALLWEGDDPAVSRSLTYRRLHEEVCRFANVMKSLGLRRGDRVTIYLPMIPELAVAMLACTRIGVVHSIVFAGFSPESLRERIRDCQGRVVITADEGLRGGKPLPLKENADEAVGKCPFVEKVIVVRRTGSQIPWTSGRDFDWEGLMQEASADCPPEEMDAEDPLFILYTSGSTGKPKGVLHTTGGYLLFTAMSHQHIFDYHDGDIYWCTADIGWVTGHSYTIYGPLANGATTVMFEGVPNYPDWSRFWRIVDKHGVTILYTAPTAIRALMRQGDEPVRKTFRKTLRLLGTVGEPINPEAWLWYYNVVGEKRCPIVDTWWQTETGGILITPFPGAMALKPGSAARPYFGVKPAIMDSEGRFLEGTGTGNLVITEPWPGMLRTIYGDHQRFLDTYFSTYKGVYFTGDGARRDEDGDYWITGRVDDVINVSGHRLGTAEVESALAAHSAVAEAAVVGFPHEIKGQGIYAYVTLKTDRQPSDALRKELVSWVRREIGAIAAPDFIQWAPGLPKTRSGKIMRRILRKIAADDIADLGDTTTLAEPAVVDDLLKGRLAAAWE
ncbi:acetate--CoA ligase [Syntrophus aciditrophicus]|uniref:Acetyl-coenzyme A synthetase n=1 Tax=Syntrophus aciditrophicus (strain SB) TaxID=56780 RepID=ACSA_SYNAS|nr:acetate--CoA ligase [Syntrophus aciditrophicus]Q2LW77.1 RecName: Full=Acetyl-coenzyme A synthetase; Short=AcCoA synthetase; Short=Acs; AltName: Full=Acetate--CoA ligase; AltName: Full=Acyl-activating enzyme [Syntrophus aciditrophicus SB]ABC78335.1 acetyl-CoA synthetase [Syntrophus aciditrophicus SB]